MVGNVEQWRRKLSPLLARGRGASTNPLHSSYHIGNLTFNKEDYCGVDLASCYRCTCDMVDMRFSFRAV